MYILCWEINRPTFGYLLFGHKCIRLSHTYTQQHRGNVWVCKKLGTSGWGKCPGETSGEKTSGGKCPTPPYGPGPEVSASPVSWMIRPWLQLINCLVFSRAAVALMWKSRITLIFANLTTRWPPVEERTRLHSHFVMLYVLSAATWMRSRRLLCQFYKYFILT